MAMDRSHITPEDPAVVYDARLVRGQIDFIK